MFYGRDEEIRGIRQILEQKNGSCLVYGKRKIGKTTLLIQTLGKDPNKTVYFECLRAPLNDNVDEFCRTLFKENILPVLLHFASFGDVFAYLNTLNQRFNIIIDEYPYLKQFESGETIDSIFQNIIDTKLSNIHLFVSGSHVGMMKDLLEEKNALYGRFSLIINLKELNYKEAASFYKSKSAYEKIGFYAVFGGSPFVCEQIDESEDLKWNIKRLLLSPLSSVYSYADNILISDLSKSINAERIMSVIGNGKRKYGEIENLLGMSNNGLLSKQLKTLLTMECIRRSFPINRPEDNKKLSYELTDNLMRFWYTYVYKNKSALTVLGADAFYEAYIEPSIPTFIAHRMEELVRDYFSLETKAGHLKGVENIGTLYYDDSIHKKNGEFDVAIQYAKGYGIYEVKYKKEPLSLQEMKKEIAQVREIPGILVKETGFVSANGYEADYEDCICINGEALYD